MRCWVAELGSNPIATRRIAGCRQRMSRCRPYVNQVRRAVRETSVAVFSETEPSLICAPSQLGSLELRDLDRALAKLPEDQRAVILLAGLEGMPYETIADFIGVPVGTIRSRLSRGRATLRQLIGIPSEPRKSASYRPAALSSSDCLRAQFSPSRLARSAEALC